MNVKGLFSDDNAVSPVIGVILMVAITVILAAVIASFVLGLGEDAANTTPTASFGFDYNDQSSDVLTVTHESGDTMQASNLNASVSSASSGASDTIFGAAAGPGGHLFTDSGEVTAGTNYELDQDDFHDGASPPSTVSALDLSGSTVRVTYNDPSNDQSSTLQTWTGPDA